MFLHDLTGTEDNPAYQEMAAENLVRQYGFLRSLVRASLAAGHPMLSIQMLKALNYHAISCLHFSAGEFRPCAVTVGEYTPPPHFLVPGQMQMLTNEINRMWEQTDALVLAAYFLWKLNYIHPFVNGNGRTARAAAYLIICLKSGGLLPGDPILPELIRSNREEYVAALKEADEHMKNGAINVARLHGLLVNLVNQQLASATPTVVAQPPAEPPPPDAKSPPA